MPAVGKFDESGLPKSLNYSLRIAQGDVISHKSVYYGSWLDVHGPCPVIPDIITGRKLLVNRFGRACQAQ